jgi:hypothetical protein
LIENYYEIIKELISGIMAADGYKTLSHEALVAYLEHNYPNFTNVQILAIDELRKLRNDIVYRGFFIEPSFITRNKDKITRIIDSLFKVLESKIK